ncbi:MAG: hypothetical protein AAFW82_05700 [Pseudomonadota bacterium]
MQLLLLISGGVLLLGGIVLMLAVGAAFLASAFSTSAPAPSYWLVPLAIAPTLIGLGLIILGTGPKTRE